MIQAGLAVVGYPLAMTPCAPRPDADEDLRAWRGHLFMNPNGFCYPSIIMSSNLDQITADAMKLPLRDRVQLAQRLVSTLDEEVETDSDELWFAEAERRLEELRSGKVQGVPAEESFPTAREALKR